MWNLEILADATYPGGVIALKSLGRQKHLEQKRIWARDITRHMDVEQNSSPSFCAFRDGLRRLLNVP